MLATMAGGLAAKYRPRRLAQIVGQDKALAKVRAVARKGGYGGRAYFISGKSGQGKDCLAEAIAREVADDLCIRTLDAGSLTRADVEEINRTMHTFGWGKGGQAWIIDEAHGLRAEAVRAFCTYMQQGRIPRHVVFCFTTTVDGLTLFEDANEDASPLMSRCCCVALTSQGVAPVFARLVSRIAGREGMNGRPAGDYLRLANDCKANCRAMLQSVEAGEMRA